MRINTLDEEYKLILRHLLGHGVTKQTRNGEVLSAFGMVLRHNMQDGFPLLTTKKMAWKSIVTELLWFLRGDTNIKYLVDNGCHIWDGDAYKNYVKHCESEQLTDYDDMDTFIKSIKDYKLYAEKWGELGPIYGKQWRDWTSLQYDNPAGFRSSQIDQIANLISELKTNPDSRRLMVNAWNVGELDQMVLPPCHYGFQVYTRELDLEERRKFVTPEMYNQVYNGGYSNVLSHSEIDQWNVPKRAISLMWNQRSVDTFLGLPFNIASYGLLLEIIAKEVNMVPDDLIGNLGDIHLYTNHIEQAKEQCSREGFELPSVTITERNWYMHEKVKEHLGEKTFIEKIESYRPEDFTLNNYQSHPSIKAPLSN
jgi:thymidylate synthase